MYDADGEKELTPLMRCNFVYVPQGNTLLSGTIRENLLLGDATATDEMMREALRKSCAEFVFNLPDGSTPTAASVAADSPRVRRSA